MEGTRKAGRAPFMPQAFKISHAKRALVIDHVAKLGVSNSDNNFVSFLPLSCSLLLRKV